MAETVAAQIRFQKTNGSFYEVAFMESLNTHKNSAFFDYGTSFNLPSADLTTSAVTETTATTTTIYNLTTAVLGWYPSNTLNVAGSISYTYVDYLYYKLIMRW